MYEYVHELCMHFVVGMILDSIYISKAFHQCEDGNVVSGIVVLRKFFRIPESHRYIL